MNLFRKAIVLLSAFILSSCSSEYDGFHILFQTNKKVGDTVKFVGLHYYPNSSDDDLIGLEYIGQDTVDYYSTPEEASCFILKEIDEPNYCIKLKRGISMLKCRNNELKFLDIINDPKQLNYLDCSNNNLRVLDTRELMMLNYLDCSHNQLDGILFKNVNLKYLICNNNKIKNLFLDRECPSLNWLDCSFNELSTLIASEIWTLNRIDCSNNKLYQLDIKGCSGLESLDCSKNQLQLLDLLGCLRLSYLYCSNNKLKFLKLGSSTYNFEYISLSNNLFTEETLLWLISDLEYNKKGEVIVQSDIDEDSSLNENTNHNQVTKKVIQKARKKGWRLKKKYLRNNEVEFKTL